MMKRFILSALLLFSVFTASFAQETDSAYVRSHYTKIERQIVMRDGVKLFTSIYLPKDQTKKYPFLISRTPYTVAPYGEDKYKLSLGTFPALMREGFIFVYQDVRGKWMSEGTFEDVRPQTTQKGNKAIDESTDTYDTIDWLVKNIQNNNGKAGISGISYPGFYSTTSLPNAHPALKAVSPQAPVTDWYMGDDFHHRGVLFLNDAFKFMTTFGVPRPKPITPDKGPRGIKLPIKDDYRFYLEAGSVKNLKDKYFADSIKFWNDLFKHPNLDTFWKARVILPHLTNVKPAVMVVGGFFDAEDAYGTFATYKAIEKQNPGANNILVAGPWFHGGWVRSDGSYFGDSWDEYVSDPNAPVPYQDGVQDKRTREYMIDDQRFAARRPDVKVYQTDVLTEDITLTGPVLANLVVSTTGTDADYVVKLIDVYPEDAPNPVPNPKNLIMGGYQMLVRGEIMRGKYRNSFEKPEAFVPNTITKVNYPLPDVAHTFKKGHKIMIQIQNSWFSLADRNPQKFMDIYQAQPSDFQKATHKIYHDVNNSSFITVNVLKP
ncbi:MAG: CocE/NonD family hydrolase [Pedobacter sp.]|nr:MAG: CocE/NonD family hydrolase [Pedobacter sp.]